MNDKPKKADPADKKLEPKEEKPAGTTAEQARNQLVNESLDDRPAAQTKSNPDSSSQNVILGGVEDWIQSSFIYSHQEKNENPKQEQQGSKYAPEENHKTTVATFEGSPDPQTMLDMAQVRVQSGQAKWPEVSAAQLQPDTNGKGESGPKKTEDKTCTEADSPKTNLDDFPEFFRKQQDQKPPSNPIEEQRQEQQAMREAAARAPMAETPHPASVDMWTKQATPGSWEAIDSIYGKPMNAKFDSVGIGQTDAGGAGKPGYTDGSKPGAELQAGHSSGGTSAQEGGERHASIDPHGISGKPDLSGGRADLGGGKELGTNSGKPEISTGRSDLAGGPSKGESGSLGRADQHSFEPAGRSELGGKPNSPHAESTTGGGTSRHTDLSTESRSERNAADSRGDLRQSDSVAPARSTNSNAEVISSQRSSDERAGQKLSEFGHRISSAEEQNTIRTKDKETNSKEFELPPTVRYVPEIKETSASKPTVQEQQVLPINNLARVSLDSKNVDQISPGVIKRAEGSIADKSAPVALTDLKSASIFRDFRANETTVSQDFKGSVDSLKLIANLEGRLQANALRSSEPGNGIRSGEASIFNSALKSSELGLAATLSSREGSILAPKDGRPDQSIFSTKIGDVQNSARAIDMLLGSKSELANTKAADQAGRDAKDRGEQSNIAARGIKVNVSGLKDDLIGNRLGNAEISAIGRGERGGFEIVGATDRNRPERGQRSEIDDLAELKALLDKSSKLSEKRYLTGVEIALAAAIAAVAVAKTRNEKELAVSQAELAAKQLRELMDDTDLTTPDMDEEANDQLSLPWQADSGGDRKRPEYVVAHNDTLLSIAELFYNDSAVAWLIADINKDKFSEFNEDGKRIIEMRSRQAIELPLWSEVHEFLRNRSELIKKTEIVTIVSETEVDRELLDSFLSTVIGISANGEGKLADAFGNVSLAAPAGTDLQSPGANLAYIRYSTGQEASIPHLARGSYGDNAALPALAGAGLAATTAIAMEGNQMGILLSLGRKLLPSLNVLKKAGMNLQSYVSGRDWQHSGLSRHETEQQ